MPPKRASRKSAPAQSRSRDEASETETAGGDEHGDLNVREENLKSNMAKDSNARTKLRKSEKQGQIETVFENQAQELEEEIEERVEEYQQEMKNAQDAFVARLLALAQKKASIEVQIVQNVQDLAEAYQVVKGDFQAVLKGRSEEFHEAIKALHDLQGEGNTSPNEQH